MTTHYADNLAQTNRLANHPRVSATFALDKGLWDGRRVAVRCITRGASYRRTARRIYYGTLDLAAGSADQIGLRLENGEVVLLHRERAVDLYDLTRRKDA